MDDKIQKIIEEAHAAASTLALERGVCGEARFAMLLQKQLIKVTMERCLGAVDCAGGDNTEYHMAAIKRQFEKDCE